MPPGYQAIIGMLAGGFVGIALGELASRYPRISAAPEPAAEIRARSRALRWATPALPVLTGIAFLLGGILSRRFLGLMEAQPLLATFFWFASVFLYPDLVRGAFELSFAITPTPPWRRLVSRTFLASPLLRHRGALRLAICLGALVLMRAVGRALERAP